MMVVFIEVSIYFSRIIKVKTDTTIDAVNNALTTISSICISHKNKQLDDFYCTCREKRTKRIRSTRRESTRAREREKKRKKDALFSISHRLHLTAMSRKKLRDVLFSISSSVEIVGLSWYVVRYIFFSSNENHYQIDGIRLIHSIKE